MRIVLKFGSGILASAGGNSLDEAQFARLSAEVAALVAAGHECIIVSSGAVAAGLMALGLAARPEELSARQACAAVGQSRLMQLYARMFEGHGLIVGQLLLTHGDLDSRTRHQNVRNTLERLIAHRGVVPVINENDSITVKEIRFGENDGLSALDAAATAPFIGTLGTGDSSTVAGGANRLTYNGVAFSKGAVQNGQYSLWGYQHLFAKPGLSATKLTLVKGTTKPADPIKSNGLANAIDTALSTSANNVQLSTMKVGRSSDGSPIFPN
jgi:hypothetical protein